MSVADNSILRVAAHFAVYGSSDAVNIFHVVMDSVGDVSEANVLADLRDYVEDMYANLEGYYSSADGLDELEAWVWNETLARWDSIGAVDGTWTGTQGSSSRLPVGVAPLIQASTTDAHARGRKYLIPMLETALEGGTWETAVLTALAAAAADWITTYIGNYAEWAPGVWQEATEAFKQFSGTATVNSVPAYQRRRKPGVGS